MASDASMAPEETPVSKVARKAFRGGIAGLAGGAVQVALLMWLRTAMNYQSRHGGTVNEALRALYSQGGIKRFYLGLSYAIIQGPLSRFGGVAANEGSRELAKHVGLREEPDDGCDGLGHRVQQPVSRSPDAYRHLQDGAAGRR